MKAFWSGLDKNMRVLVGLAGVVLMMGAFTAAAVPFYDWFCRTTGFGGTTGVVNANEGEVLDQAITVRFEAATERDMPWEFKPVQREMEVKIGQNALAFYEAHNPTDMPIAGQASYNVVPEEAGAFFDKIECFCFTEQVLQPGETVEMPVSFRVDPEIVDDYEGQYIHTITLGYTFYQIDLPEGTQTAMNTTLAVSADEPIN